MEVPKRAYQALILVGGLGTRLRPYTEQVPKPMVEIDGRPFLEFKIESLRKHGIKDFILLVGHLGEKVEEYCDRYDNYFLLECNKPGPGAARNIGIEFSHGEYISFLDVDDELEPDKYIVLLKIVY